ncbi:MAG: endonuclease VIII [Xanthomonadales bacterium]|jgi:endonuclease-8|nr:endonuclease VIII [Xanthomonadales bacterium]
MPEGPEIRLAADRIAKVLEGQVVESVEFAFPELKPFESKLQGQVVRRVDTRGKAMLTRFENDLTIYSHNQLYGRWYTSRRGELPRTNRSLRVALHTAERSALLYSASDVDVLDAEGLSSHPFLNRLGPDLLDPDLEAAELAERLQSKPFRGRSLASLLLDQSFLAGLGNYLRSEILFCAGVDPLRRPRELDGDRCLSLAEASLALGWRSYRTRGVTLDKAQRDRLEESGRKGARRNRFWVFARAGQPCYRCGTSILKEVRGSRRIYRCPACQQ